MRRVVRVVDLSVERDHQHAFLERVKDLFEQAAFTGQALDQIGEVDRIERIEPTQHPIKRGVFLTGHKKFLGHRARAVNGLRRPLASLVAEEIQLRGIHPPGEQLA